MTSDDIERFEWTVRRFAHAVAAFGEFCGMMGENQARALIGSPPAYTDAEFAQVVDRHSLVNIEEEVEKDAVRKARARLRLIIDKAAEIPELRQSQDVYREVAMLVSHAKSALRALGGKEQNNA